MLPELKTGVVVDAKAGGRKRFRLGGACPRWNLPGSSTPGIWYPAKGVDVLLRAVARTLERRGIACRLKILGEGPTRASFDLLARPGPGGPGELRAPFVPQGQMAEEYGASTVTVLPSRGPRRGWV